MAEVRIEEVLAQREFDTQNGPMVAYKVRFSGPQGNGEAETKRKASSPAPQAGETFDAEIIEGKFGPELKRIFAQKNGSSGGGSKPSDFRTPEQIMRSYAHNQALRYWELKHAADPTFAFAGWGDYTKVVDLFYGDVKAAS